ncbi:MAG: PAS domain S-box protein [Terriglobia bacterium]|jgi:PAS domain S-box-containing protein
MVVPTRTKINLGFGLALTFLAVISVFTYRESLRSIQAVHWVDHTHETLEQLATTLSLVVEAEAARRGYVLTGDPSFLDRYDTIPARLESSLQRLRELTSDKPNDEGRLHQLEPLIRNKLESLHTSIQLRKEQGTATAEQEMFTKQGKTLADQIRRLTEEMQEEQRTLLIERTAKSQESAWTTVKIAAVGSSLALVMILVSLLMFNISVSKRQHAEEALRTSQERYRDLFENANDIIFTHDGRGVFTSINKAGEQVIGYASQDLLRMNLFDVLAPEYVDRAANLLKSVTAETARVTGDWEIIARGGRRVLLEISERAIFQGERVASVEGIARDITERKRVEMELAAINARLDAVLNSATQVAIIATDTGGVITTFNTGAERMLGYSREEMVLKQTPMAFHLASEVEAHGKEFTLRLGHPVEGFEVFVALPRRGECEARDWTYVRKDGTHIIVNLFVTAITNSTGVLTGFLGVATDITEQKRATAALSRSERRFRALVESGPDANVLVDGNGRIVQVNQRAEEMFGYHEAELVGCPIEQLIPPRFRLRHEVLRAEFQARPKRRLMGTRLELFGCRKDGSEFPVDVSLGPIETEEGVLIATIVTDITERRRAEQALREAEEQRQRVAEEISDLYNNAPCGYHSLDKDGVFVRINDAELSWLGYSREEIIGRKKFPDLLTAESVGVYRMSFPALKERGWVRDLEFEMVRKDGTIMPVLLNATALKDSAGNFLMSRSTIFDITERKRAEAEMAERHRLETLVAEVGVALTGAESLRQGLQQCAEILVRDINAALARIWTVNEEDQVLELQASAGMYTHLDGGHARVPMGQFKIGRIAENGEPHLTNTVQQDSGVGDPEWARREGMVAFAGYPLRVGEHVLGVVAAFARQPLTPATLQAFASVAHNLAQFIKRKRAEETLRESEEKYRALIETTGTGYVIIDTQGRVVDANPEYVWLAGRRALQEILGRRVTEWTAQHDLVRNAEAIRRCAELGFVRNLEIEYVNGDGKCTPIELNATVVPGAGGVRIVGLCRDITERKRVQQALQESEERYRDLAENAAELIQSVSPEGQFLYVNRAWRETLGYSVEEVPHLNMMDVIDTEHLPHCQEVFAKVMHGEAVNDVETVFVAKTGKRVAVRGSVNCRLVDGKHDVTNGIFRDVTARLEIEKMKDEFVSTVSHELRTPLTSIRGALGLLTAGVLSAEPAKARRMLEIAVANTDRLIRLINDILDIERIESGRVKLEKRSCNAASLMVQAMDSVREVANRAGVKLELFPTSGSVLADPDRVVQTLTNLVGNAIKFSPPSSTVTLRATRRQDEMLFEVKDQGRGIPADKLGVIFERFQQVDASDGREKGGTGLGLAICRSIVDQHGGRIWVESELGQGSSFYFTLPLLKEQVETPFPETSPSQRTVLICDDDPSIRNVVKTLLEQHGYSVLAAGSGMEAIRQAAACQPDAILLDLLMPEMDGWETLAALRDRPATSEIPVVILSVLPPRETRETDGVVAGWVQKPVDEARLFQTLSVGISGSSKPARVLVVEDDLDLAHVIQEVFERHGYKVFHAQTGSEAIQSAERVFPNLIVLDLVLPEGDGFDVVAGLRHNKALRSVPLVVYTAKDIDEAEREKLKLGETVFLTKGRISPEEFEKRVIGLLDRLTSVRPEGRLR